jgi:carbonic anhydrase/acetyltransferase-like protein (isoleucine patch superfamily)
MNLNNNYGQLWRLSEHQPRVNPSVFIAPGAHVIGDVEIGEDSSLWFNAVLRGDLEPIVVGKGSNIQDGAVLHTDEGFPCVIGNNVTIGHRAVVHGATIEDEALVGMGAVVLNGAKLGKGAVLGAGAVLAEGKEIPAGMLALGVPAKVTRPVEPGDGGAFYRNNAKRFLQQLEPFLQESQPNQQTRRSE